MLLRILQFYNNTNYCFSNEYPYLYYKLFNGYLKKKKLGTSFKIQTCSFLVIKMYTRI